MVIPKIDKRKKYARYAGYCLNMMATTEDQEVRSISREMAVGWLKLADTVLQRSKRPK